MFKNYFILFAFSTLLISCAQYAAPTGGKKDEIPPKLKSSIPVNKTLNFKGKEIKLVFDELVESTSLQQELIVTPALEGTYTVKNNGTEIKLKIDKPLRDSTTYTFNFVNGIKDLSEKNPASNLKIVFSTGDKIDSLSYNGTVKYLQTNSIAQNVLVGLYRINQKDTIPLLKSKPYYFIKTDTSGIFNFENLKNGKYRVLVFNDQKNPLIWDEKNEEFDFQQDTINLDKNITNQQFKISMIDRKGPKMLRNTTRSEDHQITFEETIVNANLKFTKGDSLPYSFKDKQINIYNPNKNSTDSVFVKVVVKDSTDNEAEYEIKFKFKEQDKKKKLKTLFFETSPTSQEGVEPSEQYKLVFQSPIKTINLSKIKLNADSTTTDTLKIEDIKWNKTQTELFIKKPIKVKNFLTLEIEKGAMINVLGDSSVKYNIKNNIIKAEDYGSLEGKISSYQKTQFVVQLITEDFKVVQEMITDSKYKFKKIKEGIYFVRVIYDIDRNKKWSRGDFEKNLKAEEIVFSTKIRIKANFDVEGFDIQTVKK